MRVSDQRGRRAATGLRARLFGDGQRDKGRFWSDATQRNSLLGPFSSLNRTFGSVAIGPPNSADFAGVGFER
jgi:hypothetical protein